MSQLAQVAHRQKACIAALQRERANLAARSADPAQVAALRAEAAALQRRLQELNGLKVQVVIAESCDALSVRPWTAMPGRGCLLRQAHADTLHCNCQGVAILTGKGHHPDSTRPGWPPCGGIGNRKVWRRILDMEWQLCRRQPVQTLWGVKCRPSLQRREVADARLKQRQGQRVRLPGRSRPAPERRWTACASACELRSKPQQLRRRLHLTRAPSYM